MGLASPIVRLENRHFPNFYVENLQSGTAFGMVVYAQNTKVSESLSSLAELPLDHSPARRTLQGESGKQVLRAFTLKNAARQVDNPELAKVGNKRGHLIIGGAGDSDAFGPFFWVVLSVASVLVSVSVVLALVIRTRCFMGRGGRIGGAGAGGAAASGRRGEWGMTPFQKAKGRRRSSGGQQATMRFPRHEMEVGRAGEEGQFGIPRASQSCFI